MIVYMSTFMGRTSSLLYLSNRKRWYESHFGNTILWVNNNHNILWKKKGSWRIIIWSTLLTIIEFIMVSKGDGFYDSSTIESWWRLGLYFIPEDNIASFCRKEHNVLKLTKSRWQSCHRNMKKPTLIRFSNHEKRKPHLFPNVNFRAGLLIICHFDSGKRKRSLLIFLQLWWWRGNVGEGSI